MSKCLRLNSAKTPIVFKHLFAKRFAEREQLELSESIRIDNPPNISHDEKNDDRQAIGLTIWMRQRFDQNAKVVDSREQLRQNRRLPGDPGGEVRPGVAVRSVALPFEVQISSYKNLHH
jgi:hypothetical protein